MASYSVLIVDDDIWMQRILAKTMSSYGFKTTHLASNGFDGIGKAVEHLPDIIILDILMPDLSGHLTLRVLKSIKLTKDIPVVMVSAMSDVENLGRAVKSGTAGFISKPFTRATVYEKLIDIYGRERLELIMSGKDIGRAGIGYETAGSSGGYSSKPASPYSGITGEGSRYADDAAPQFEDMDTTDILAALKNKKAAQAPPPPPPPPASSNEDSGAGQPAPSVSPAKLNEHYQEDEKRSIESIKALLLKGKPGDS